MDNGRWSKAVEHAQTLLVQYKTIGPAGVFGARVIMHALSLYEAGDRSKQLLEELEGFE